MQIFKQSVERTLGPHREKEAVKGVGIYCHNPGIGPSLACLTALALSNGSLDVFASRPLPPSTISGNLSPGDIIYADSGTAVDGGVIVKVDPLSGEQVVL